MALSNRDRIGKAMELLGPALNRFLTTVVDPELPDGTTWIDLLKLKDNVRPGPSGRAYNADDPSNGFRMIADNITHNYRRGWRPIGQHLSRLHEAYATELKEVRNRHAHMESFDNDSAQRALETSELMLTALGAPDDALEVKKVRLDLRRTASERADREVVRRGTATVGSDSLPPWREVVVPHRDVQTDNLNAAEFAADLYTVSTGQGTGEYSDPVEFFRRTYLTRGLSDLIGRFGRRLTGDMNASPVINLQTNFGGGKTHSMLALWHLASGRPLADYPDEVSQLLQGYDFDSIRSRVQRVAVVGTWLQATGTAPKPDGTRVRTMWGEIAWQLGGREAYDVVADSDQSATNPGESLRELLSLYTPAIILIDEWVAYARQLYSDATHPGGSFDTQFTFAQTLTEAAKSVSGVQVVISIPASNRPGDVIDDADEEQAGGVNGQEALARLKTVVGRVADPWTPADPQESFEIVRRRLFQDPGAEALGQISGIADGMMTFYRKHSADLPREVRENEYRDHIKRCYPIHPEFFDRLYTDWSTLHRFQRTRGVLRLMNTVVGELWRSRDAAPLIMPGSLPLDADDVITELTHYLDDNWKPIIYSDIDGVGSASLTVEAESGDLFGKRHDAVRLARTIFFAAAPTLTGTHRGVDKKRIFLGTAVPGDTPGNFHSALDHLANKSTYLYTEGPNYWYSTHPNTTRAALDYAAELAIEDVWEEVRVRLETIRKISRDNTFAGVVVFPSGSDGVADQQDTRLVIVPMSATHQSRPTSDTDAVRWAKSVVDQRGTANRTHRNTVVFLAADANRARDLEKSVREYLAWSHISGNVDQLTGQQVEQARTRASRAEETVNSRILDTFVWALYPYEDLGSEKAGYRIEVTDTKGSTTDLIARTAKKLVDNGALEVQRSASGIRLDLDTKITSVWSSGHVSFGELFALYTTYPYLARLRDRGSLEDGVLAIDSELMSWERNGFALAESFDGERYQGLRLPTDEAPWPIPTNSTLLVKPDVALRERKREESEWDNDGEQEGGDEKRDEGQKKRRVDPPLPPGHEPKRRYFGSVSLGGDFYVRNFNDIADAVLQHLSSTPGVELDVRLEIRAVSSGGFDDTRVRNVRENASTLGFDDNEFEQE